MNWSEIKEKYPRSYEKYDINYNISSNADCCGEHHPNQRVLFDFFDEQGIFISVSYDLPNPPFFFLITNEKVEIEDNYWIADDKRYNSRDEAETEAFTTAFEILEERVK